MVGGMKRRFLRFAGIAEEGAEEQLICFGIVEGGTPCFVYRTKGRSGSTANKYF